MIWIAIIAWGVIAWVAVQRYDTTINDLRAQILSLQQKCRALEDEVYQLKRRISK